MTDNRKVKILDTTLRDGTQSEDISYSVEDKIKIAKELDALGIDYIEGGNPFSNETDRAFFERMKGERLSARLVAFCSTRRKETAAEDDENLRAALCADTPAVSVFGKCYDMQAEKILGVSLKENLAMIKESVAFLKTAGREVIFDAEHFFDGLKSNRKYALECLKAASDAGADIICLCDTNGGSLPEEIAKGVKAALKSTTIWALPSPAPWPP